MTTIESDLRPVPRVPLWRNVRVLRVVAQIVAVVIVGYVVYRLYDHRTTHLTEVDSATDFAVLRRPATFAIRDDPGFAIQGPLVPNMMWIGVENTLISAFVGIAIAVVLG